MEKLRQWVAAIRYYSRIFRPCALNLILAIGIPFVFILVLQAMELLRCMAENEFSFSNPSTWQRIFFLLSLTTLSLHAWYFSRVLLYIRYADSPDLTKVARRIRMLLPRFAGVAPCLIMARAAWRTAGLYDPGDPARSDLRFSAGVFVATAAVLYLFFYFRRRRLKHDDWEYRNTRIASGIGLPSGTRRALFCFAAFSTVLFIIFTAIPVRAAQFLGAGSILLLAGAGWISVGSFLVHLSRRFAIPIFRFIAGLVVLFSLTNDNHQIREIATAALAKKQPTPEEHFNVWKEKMARFSPTERRHPVFIVATEGGGIRAAYWTATVLGELQQTAPHFGSHVFAISGVSGGSLGATVFTALLAQNRTDTVKHDAQAILSHDFLAPTLAYMLYPDLVQRFWPAKINSFDRARALEFAWERAWTAEIHNAFFSQPFQALWSSQSSVPSLFLNGTAVETGNRIIASNLDFSEFAHAENPYAALNADIPMSTAVHMSARFTYVSPAGLLRDGTHVVDGGYFENSGAATAEEIKSGLDVGDNSSFDVYYILINSEGERPRSGKLLNEVVIPIRALLNTRTARASYSTALVIDDSIEFKLDLRGNSIPLGWQLSRVAMAEMERQLRSTNNAEALRKVRSILQTD